MSELFKILQKVQTIETYGYTYKSMNYLLMAEKAYKESYRVRCEILGEGHRKTNEVRKLLDEVVSKKVDNMTYNKNVYGIQDSGYGGGIESMYGSSLPPPGTHNNATTGTGGSGTDKSGSNSSTNGGQYKVNQLMKAIGAVGDRTYVPKRLR